jgi:predicted acylesterase/phospholipase RssA
MARTALVISGGGAKGAFAVGVANRLHAGAGLEFDIIAGTSTGAIIAPLALLGNYAQLRLLYQQFDSSQLFRELTPLAALQAGYLLDTGGLRALCARVFTPALFDALQQATAGGKQLVAAAVGIESGRLTYFYMGAEPVRPSDRDAFAIESAADLVDAVMASASQPVVMQPATFRGRVYVDGGIREYVPIRVAVDNGATDVYAVLLSLAAPDPAPGTQGLVATLLRTIDLFGNEVMRDDVETPQVIHDAVALTEALRTRLDAAIPAARETIDGTVDAVVAASPFAQARLANLYAIYPDATLLADSLHFNVQDMNRMMGLGEDKADRLIAEGFQPVRILV